VVYVFTDWYMCSRIGICAQGSGICVHGLVYVLKVVVYVFTDWYVFTDVHNCAQGSGICVHGCA
jgi:hypothetical protein